jgi:cyanophycin synthetase
LNAIGGTRCERQRAILLHPLLTAAVFECSAAGLAEGGLPFDQCNVGILTLPATASKDDAARQRRTATADGANGDLPPVAELQRVIADTVSHAGQLLVWEDVPLSPETLAANRGGVIWLLLEGDDRRVVELAERGGRAAFIRDHSIWLTAGGRQWPLAEGESAPKLQNLAAANGWRAVLAAGAAGWALGLPEVQLASALAAYAAG